MNEHSYTKSILRQLPLTLYRWKINDTYAGGVPDLFIEGSHRDLWIEVKYINQFPKRPSTMIDLTHKKYLSKLQQHWLRRRAMIRNDSYVLVGSEHGGHLFCNDDWQIPFPASFLVNNSVKTKDIAATLQTLASSNT